MYPDILDRCIRLRSPLAKNEKNHAYLPSYPNAKYLGVRRCRVRVLNYTYIYIYIYNAYMIATPPSSPFSVFATGVP